MLFPDYKISENKYAWYFYFKEVTEYASDQIL